jgi:vancomycin resistance protein YoaR
MRKWFGTVMAAALLGVSGLHGAEEKENKRAPKPALEKLAAEDREARIKEWRRTNNLTSRAEMEKRREQSSKLTPEEREAKRKELRGRLEKRISELREKGKNSTLTTQETRELERREQILKRFEPEAAAPKVEHPKATLTNSPAK